MTLHELGHTSWHHKMGGIRADDFPKSSRPFSESYQGSQLLGNIYSDSSIHYFRNDEYMAGFRNRDTLDQTYGDILIERLLSRYGVNYRNYKYVFVPQMGHNANFGGSIKRMRIVIWIPKNRKNFFLWERIIRRCS